MKKKLAAVVVAATVGVEMEKNAPVALNVIVAVIDKPQ